MFLHADEPVQFPYNREISEAFNRASEMAAKGQTERAAELLLAIAELPVAEQVFLATTDPQQFVGCRVLAEQLLRNLTVRPLSVAEALAIREAAKLGPQPSDEALLAIIGRYPNTRKAAELRVRLGDLQFERGDAFLARMTWERQLRAGSGFSRAEIKERLAQVGQLPEDLLNPQTGHCGDRTRKLVYDGARVFVLDGDALVGIDVGRRRRIWVREDLGGFDTPVLAAGYGRVGLLTRDRLRVLSGKDGGLVLDVVLDPAKLDLIDGAEPAGLVLLSSGGTLLVFHSPPPRCEIYSVRLPPDGKLQRSSYLVDCDADRLPLELSVGPDGQGDVLVHLALRGAVFSLRGSTGELLWARMAKVAASKPPELGWRDGVLCLRLEKHKISGLDPADGALRFALDARDGSLVPGRTGPVVLAGKDRALLVDLQTGRRVGMLDFAKLQIAPAGDPIVVRGALWIPVRGGVVRVELATGQVTRHRLEGRRVELLNFGGDVFCFSGRSFEVLRADP